MALCCNLTLFKTNNGISVENHQHLLHHGVARACLRPVCQSLSHGLFQRLTKHEVNLSTFNGEYKKKRSLFIRFATIEEIEAEKEQIEEAAMEKMEKTLESVKGNFNTIRTGRAAPALLDRLEVEYYGTPVLLKSIAQISAPDGSTLLVQPFDRSSLTSIEKALSKSTLGVTPSNDGTVIRLNIPQPTSERRKELLKEVAKVTEEGKVAIRNVRRDAIKSYEKLAKDKKISEDNAKDLSADIQKLTDEYVKKVDSMYTQKEKELLSV